MAWTVDQPGATLAAFVKARAGVPWSVAKRQIAAGKVFVDGALATAVDLRLAAGQEVELRAGAPRPRDPAREGALVYDDAHVVVLDKPSGVNSVPYEDRETGTAMDLIRAAWRRQGKPATTIALHVVHRIDRATSGLLMFAKTKRAELGLAAQLRAHTVTRSYLCVAHGAIAPGQAGSLQAGSLQAGSLQAGSLRIESYLVRDRGDGLRGSTTRRDQGKRAVTHVEVVRPLRGATLCRVHLETGKTHQIRIHLAEAGHPLVGEQVYIRDYRGPVLPSPRLLLHAATLGFDHPVTGARIELSSPLPPDFAAVLEALSRA